MRELAPSNDRPLQALDGPGRSAGQKTDDNPQPNGVARDPIYSPSAPFLLPHLLFPRTIFVRFTSAPSIKTGSGGAFALAHAFAFSSSRFGLAPAPRMLTTFCNRSNQNGAPRVRAVAVIIQPRTCTSVTVWYFVFAQFQ